jgi:hypothetical protein
VIEGRLPFPVLLSCTAVAVQPVGVPLVTFGPDENTAAWALAPTVMIAPPPSSFVPPVHVAVEADELVKFAELPPKTPAAPATTVELATDPAGPVAPVAPWMPWAPVAPVSPLGP